MIGLGIDAFIVTLGNRDPRGTPDANPRAGSILDIERAAASRLAHGTAARIRCRRCSVPAATVRILNTGEERRLAAHSADPDSSNEPEERSCLSRCAIARLRRSPAMLPGFHAGCPPRNKRGGHGLRLRGLIVMLWRAGLRVHDALALAEADLDQRRGAVLVRRGKGGHRRVVGIDAWGSTELQLWLETRVELPIGRLLSVLSGPTRGRH